MLPSDSCPPLSEQVSAQRETRVLFVTLTNNVSNTILQHDKYYQAFSPYGEVQRILIFKKIEPWATFVEMDSTENAKKARRELNNTQILPDGTRINVISSTKERIEFQEKNSAGIDYTILKQKIIEKKQTLECELIMNQCFESENENGNNTSVNTDSIEVKRESNSNTPNSSFSSTDHGSIKPSKTQFKYIPRFPSETDMQQPLQRPLKLPDVADLEQLTMEQSLYGKSGISTSSGGSGGGVVMYSGISPKQATNSISNANNFNSTISSEGNSKITPIKAQRLTSSAPNNLFSNKSESEDRIYENVDENTNLSDYLHPQFQKMATKTKVIYANHFDPSKTTLTQIFNLFSAFGNIEKMIFLKSKQAVIIEYDLPAHAGMAKDCLGDCTFNGSIIKVFNSHYENVFFKDPSEKPEDEEYFQPSEKDNRFKHNTPATINPPINTLHVSNLRRDSCSYETIKKLFEPYSKVQQFKFLLEQNNKNMCLIRFDNPTAAMWVLANTHNIDINGRLLKVSFSKRALQ